MFQLLLFLTIELLLHEFMCVCVCVGSRAALSTAHYSLSVEFVLFSIIRLL